MRRAATPALHDPRAPPNAKFKGFGRSATDKDGVFSFDTIKPGAVPGPDGKPQAPHIVFCIFSRGMLRQIYTRMYFPDEAANAADPILNLVPADRRADPDRQEGGRAAPTASTSACRATTRRFSSRSETALRGRLLPTHGPSCAGFAHLVGVCAVLKSRLKLILQRIAVAHHSMPNYFCG